MGVQFSGSFIHLIHTMHQGHRNERISRGLAVYQKMSVFFGWQT